MIVCWDGRCRHAEGCASAVGSSSCRILFRCRCWRRCHCWHVSGCLDRGHHVHISSTRPHGIGATYLDGYGERREGNGSASFWRLDLAGLHAHPHADAAAWSRDRQLLLPRSPVCPPLRLEGRVETASSLLGLQSAAGCHSLCPGLLFRVGRRVGLADRQCLRDMARLLGGCEISWCRARHVIEQNKI